MSVDLILLFRSRVISVRASDIMIDCFTSFDASTLHEVTSFHSLLEYFDQVVCYGQERKCYRVPRSLGAKILMATIAVRSRESLPSFLIALDGARDCLDEELSFSRNAISMQCIERARVQLRRGQLSHSSLP